MGNRGALPSGDDYGNSFADVDIRRRWQLMIRAAFDGAWRLSCESHREGDNDFLVAVGRQAGVTMTKSPDAGAGGGPRRQFLRRGGGGGGRASGRERV